MVQKSVKNLIKHPNYRAARRHAHLLTLTLTQTHIHIHIHTHIWHRWNTICLRKTIEFQIQDDSSQWISYFYNQNRPLPTVLLVCLFMRIVGFVLLWFPFKLNWFTERMLTNFLKVFDYCLYKNNPNNHIPHPEPRLACGLGWLMASLWKAWEPEADDRSHPPLGAEATGQERGVGLQNPPGASRDLQFTGCERVRSWDPGWVTTVVRVVTIISTWDMCP